MGFPARSRIRTKSTDEEQLREVIRFTARTLKTAHPSPFGASIVESKSGKALLRAVNAVMRENDPSSHAEVRAIRMACKRLKTTSLSGYTLYSTCEPCPMCMANALWARVDRVVFGATIEDANRYCLQIHIPAQEVSRRSDMAIEVKGSLLRNLCGQLLEHPSMGKAFKKWSTSKRKTEKG